MKQTQHTPEGISLVDLDQKEVEELAKRGDPEALQEWAANNYPLHSSLQDKLDVLAVCLGILPFPD